MAPPRVGLAFTGSFCTFGQVIAQIPSLLEEGFDLMPIFSETSYATDTRFGKAADFVGTVEGLAGRPALHTIAGVEPIGPKALLDLLIVAPCTGNTLGKLAYGITDSCVAMAAKAHLRNGRPLLLAVSTNDALAASARSIGQLLVEKNVYFVPFRQDAPVKKPTSMVADMTRLAPAAREALEGRQIQPVILAPVL